MQTIKAEKNLANQVRHGYCRCKSAKGSYKFFSKVHAPSQKIFIYMESQNSNEAN